ncbi:MAG TPA: hypothetical protein VL551_34940 [Actinospica sp.]|jgi:hypothetical protein|nr:hypothetical protein [Actinospica sp.]
MNPAATPPAKVASIRRRYLADEPLKSIAENENCCLSTVVKNTRDLPRRQYSRTPPEIVAEIETLSARGVKRAAIANKLGVSVGTVRRYEAPTSAIARRHRSAAIRARAAR